MDISRIFSELKASSWKQRQTRFEDRLKLLQSLDKMIEENQSLIIKALKADFQKSEFETLLSEVYPVVRDIKNFKRHLKKWMKRRRVGTPLSLLGTRSEIQMESKGCVLVIAPWNYPLQLAVLPVLAALAAGNTVILKPSELASATSSLLKNLIEKYLPSDVIKVVEGGINETTELLKLPFDHIFFTGSTPVGKIVMEAASKHLASVTLELGGKSPTIIDREFSIEVAASKIAWGKFLNAGQTCIAPDYVFVHEDKLEAFKHELIRTLKLRYSENDQDYPGIISEKHFSRLQRLVEVSLKEGAQKVEIGSSSGRKFAPVLLTGVDASMAMMKEEIFGPVLPLMPYRDLKDVIKCINSGDKPLALYIFSDQKFFIEKILCETSSGGVCINDTLIHLTNHELPFGGVGGSGMGSYHGFFGFREFCHEKAILRQGPFTRAMSFFYPPYTDFKLSVLKKIIKYRL